MTVVAIYTRISSDPYGVSTATVRQAEACRAFCEGRAWAVAGVFEDHDVSAYKPRVVRPAYERLIASLDDIDGVVVWRLDRLCRRPAEFERFWSACERADAFLASATEPIDSSSELGLAIVRILVTFAQLESHAKSERLRAKAAETAAAGVPPSQVPYGYGPTWQEIVPEEAAVIREAAARYLSGDTLRHIAEDLNDRGLRTRAGRVWTRKRLRTLLGSRRHTGDRWFRGELVATECWPPIIDRDLSDQLVARLSASRQTRTPERRLLTGLLFCGRCGARLNGKRRTDWTAEYTCGQPGALLAVSALPLEGWVQHHVFWRMRILGDQRRLKGNTTPEAFWARASFEERRVLVGEHLVRAVVRPTKGLNTPPYDRIDAQWSVPVPDPPPFEWRKTHVERAELAEGGKLALADASKALGLSYRYVSQLVLEGGIPAERIGYRWILDAATVERVRLARLHRPYWQPATEDRQALRACAWGNGQHDHEDLATWVFANTIKQTARVHRACCGWCDNGRGMARKRSRSNPAGCWFGPFRNLEYARTFAAERAPDAGDCLHCRPGAEPTP